MKKKQQIDSVILALLIGALPIFMLSVGYSSAVFYAAAFISLTICFSRIGGLSATLEDWSRYKLLATGMFGLFFAVLIVMLFEQRFNGSAFERTLRLGAGTLIVLGACLSLKPDWLRQSTWGMALASITAGSQAWWFALPDFRRPDEVPEYNAVSYGNLLLLVSTITAFSIGWRLTRYPKTEAIIKSLAAMIGFSGFVVTQTRTGWLAIPWFIFIGLVLFVPKGNTKKIAILFFPAICIVLAVFATNHNLTTRAQEAITELRECHSNPTAISSVCIRLQLWRASWEMFKHNPIVGNGGTDRFAFELRNLVDKNVISDFVVEKKFGETHNDILFMIASYGLFGLIGLLLVYATPSWVFWQRLRIEQTKDIRVAAAMGLSVTLGFLVFGFTELMFRGMRTMGFYAVTVAWLLALSDPVFLKRESFANSKI